jgi:hypothetical protein
VAEPGRLCDDCQGEVRGAIAAHVFDVGAELAAEAARLVDVDATYPEPCDLCGSPHCRGCGADEWRRDDDTD